MNRNHTSRKNCFNIIIFFFFFSGTKMQPSNRWATLQSNVYQMWYWMCWRENVLEIEHITFIYVWMCVFSIFFFFFAFTFIWILEMYCIAGTETLSCQSNVLFISIWIGFDCAKWCVNPEINYRFLCVFFRLLFIFIGLKICSCHFRSEMVSVLAHFILL